MTDGGPGYGIKFTDGLAQDGCMHRVLPPYSGFSNGKIEKHNDLIKRTARRVLADRDIKDLIEAKELNIVDVVKDATTYKNEKFRVCGTISPIFAVTLYQPVGEAHLIEQSSEHLSSPVEQQNRILFEGFDEEKFC